MANLLYGVGDTFAKTKTLKQNKAADAIKQEVIIPLYLFDFEYTEDVTKIEAKGQIKGIKRTLASAPGETTSTLKLSTQYTNWSQLGFFLNQFPRQETSVSIPQLKTGRVPLVTPFEFSDDVIDEDNAAEVYVYVTDEANPTYRKVITGTGAVAAGQAKVDGATSKIVFHESDAGKPFAYTVLAVKSNTQTYGGRGGVDKYGTIEFWGTIYGTEDTIHFPSLDFSTSPSLSLTGDVATLEVEFSANVDVAGGNVYPYRIIQR